MNAQTKQTGLGVVIAVVLFAGACVSAALYADDRYAKASDLKQLIVSSQVAANVLRKQLLEDKIFELDLVPDAQKTDIQRAMANRAKTQLQEVQARVSESEKSKP